MTGTLYTPKEVADQLRVSKRAVMEWLRRGRLKGVKVGRLWRVREEDLETFLEQNRNHEEAEDLMSIRRGLENIGEGWYANMDAEDHAWLYADLDGELPPYDWGPDGPPKGKPIKYVPGTGPVIEGGR